MGVLIIQFVSPAHGPDRPEFRHELGVAAAMLRRAGVEPVLLPVSRYDPGALRAAANRHRPTQVLVDCPPTSVAAARHTIVDVAEKLFLPVIVFGPYATSQPEQAISIPGVTAVIRGEYEQALLQLLRPPPDGPVPAEHVAGVWVNSEDGLIRNEPAPPVEDLDSLPHPDRDVFDYARTVAAGGEAEFQATRGCANWCAHCLNDWYINLYRGTGKHLRRRGVGNVLEEIAEVAARYGPVRQVRFSDHAFAADRGWLEAFAAEYPRACGLPYRCHVCLNLLDGATPGLLARSGCRRADVEIGSGSNFIREEVLAMRTTRRQITEGVAALKDAGLAVHARVFVGAPYESEVSVEDTLDLLAQLRLDAVRPRVYFPVPGTRAAEVAADNGWISGRREESFHADKSVLDMPSLPAQRIDDIFRHYDALLKDRSGRGLLAWWRRFKKLSTQPVHLFGRRRRR